VLSKKFNRLKRLLSVYTSLDMERSAAIKLY